MIGEEIGFGLIGGILAGALAAWIAIAAGARNLIDDVWLPIIPVAATVLAYGIAEAQAGRGLSLPLARARCLDFSPSATPPG